MIRKRCVYCNKEITTRSREHVIQNAIGGLLESADICCPECNNYISRQIDVPFTTIFNPIIGNIDNLGKTHNKNSTPVYTGTVAYQGNQYPAYFKGKQVTSCPALSKMLRCDISKIPLETVSYNFDLKNDAFHTGIAKIAFNYALANRISIKSLQSGLKVSKNNGTITKIEYDYPIIPFCPANQFDLFLELGTPTELYHNLILFSQHNRLWCYVDLFNTFQYYVLLSNNLNRKRPVSRNYMQTLQKLDRKEPKIEISRPKDILIYAQQYGVEPCMDVEELKRRINQAVTLKSQKQSMDSIISGKLNNMSMLDILSTFNTPEQIMRFNRDTHLYLRPEDERLNTNTFRTVTVGYDCTHLDSYPDAIMQMVSTTPDALHKYTTAKFNKLNVFLCNKTK